MPNCYRMSSSHKANSLCYFQKYKYAVYACLLTILILNPTVQSAQFRDLDDLVR